MSSIRSGGVDVDLCILVVSRRRVYERNNNRCCFHSRFVDVTSKGLRLHVHSVSDLDNFVSETKQSSSSLSDEYSRVYYGLLTGTLE